MTVYQSKKAAAQDKLEIMEREALKLALEALEGFIPHLPLWDKNQCNRYDLAITAVDAALAQPAQEPAPVQEPVLKPLSKKWKWVLHKSFADVAGFDEEGIPSFYWKESVTKFKSGELSVPCKGKNCGSLNGWLHSGECRAEHEAQYTTPPQRPWVGIPEEDLKQGDESFFVAWREGARWADAYLKEKNT